MHLGVRHERVQESEYAGHQHVGREASGRHQHRAERLVFRQRLHGGGVRERGEQAERGDDQRRSDDHHAEILADAPHEAARLLDTPHEIEGLLDLLDHRQRRIKQEQHAERAEHVAAHVVDEARDLMRHLVGALAERLEERIENGLELAVIAEPFEDRERHRDQRHDRQQRRVDQAHRAERQVAAQDVADERVGIAQDASQLPQRLPVDGFRRLEQPAFQVTEQGLDHAPASLTRGR